jgi:hypothetical protein
MIISKTDGTIMMSVTSPAGEDHRASVVWNVDVNFAHA